MHFVKAKKVFNKTTNGLREKTDFPFSSDAYKSRIAGPQICRQFLYEPKKYLTMTRNTFALGIKFDSEYLQKCLKEI